MASSEWNNTYTGQHTFSQSPGPINSDWNGRNVPGTSTPFEDVYAGGLISLAQHCYVYSGNDITSHSVTFHSGADLWNNAVFRSASSIKIDAEFTCKWWRSEDIGGGSVPSETRGGLENVILILGEGVAPITSWNAGENPDDNCMASYKETSHDVGPHTFSLSGGGYMSGMVQGAILRVRMVIQTGELWLLGEETCGGSMPPGGQSTIDILEVDHPFFQRASNGSEPGGLYVNGVNPNDKEVLHSGPNFSINAGESITVWQLTPWNAWQKVNSSPSTSVSGTTMMTPAPMVAASASGFEFARWILDD